MNNWKTFILGIICLGLTFAGVYLKFLEPSLFRDVVVAVLTVYGFRTVGDKFAKGYINKHNTTDATPTS